MYSTCLKITESSISRSLLLWILATTPLHAEINFVEVTEAAGFDYSGSSWGAAWGDYNGDQLPDIWVPNHRKPPRLYENLGDGSFADVSATRVSANPTVDTHGAAWADYNNDGDQDLLQSVGAAAGLGVDANQFLINIDGQLVDQAPAFGLDYPKGRGRMPLWLDWDRDGHLDVLIANLLRPDGEAPTAIFSQRNLHFVNESAAIGFDGNYHTFFAQATGAQGQDLPLLITHAPAYPARAYLLPGMTDATGALGLAPPVKTGVQDAVIADFDNNLEPDILMLSRIERSDIEIIDDSRMRVFFLVEDSEQGIELKTGGGIRILITPEFTLSASSIYLGTGGINPPPDGTTGVHDFFVLPGNPDHIGWKPHRAGVDNGIYVGRDQAAGAWRIYVSASARRLVDVEIFALQPASEITAIDFVPGDGASADTLLRRESGVYVDRTLESGLGLDTPCDSAVAADFDNDMDQDLYFACRAMTGNAANLLLENDGTGSFSTVPLAGGAEGSDKGRGESVVAADYDLDGFVDLFVTNGADLGHFSQGPDQLFRNLGNENHWIEIDLEGVNSNRDALGARVIILAGNQVQMRENSGGIHKNAQNHRRLHFGLGPNTEVDVIYVIWPDGQSQFLVDMPADQLIQILEPSNPGLEGEPEIDIFQDSGVFVWREPGTQTYQLQVVGNGIPEDYRVRVVSAAAVDILATDGLEISDHVDTHESGFSLNSQVWLGTDTVSFSLVPGAPSLISVERNGVGNPRDLRFGPSRQPRTPAGWVMNLSEFPTPPPGFSTGDLGLFIGRTPGGDIELRWNGDSLQHTANIILFASEGINSAAAVDLEIEDQFFDFDYLVGAFGKFGPDFDGLDVNAAAGSLIGLAYTQDNLFQYNRVNASSAGLGLPNGYRLQ